MAITVPIKEETKKFVDIKAPLMFENEVEKKISNIEAQSIWDIISKTDLGSEKIEEMISNIYTEVINQGVDKFLEGIDVYGMVESKINDMGIDELEILVMSIMKKELDTIVNLGALIGFILGMINIFI